VQLPPPLPSPSSPAPFPFSSWAVALEKKPASQFFSPLDRGSFPLRRIETRPPPPLYEPVFLFRFDFSFFPSSLQKKRKKTTTPLFFSNRVLFTFFFFLFTPPIRRSRSPAYSPPFFLSFSPIESFFFLDRKGGIPLARGVPSFFPPSLPLLPPPPLFSFSGLREEHPFFHGTGLNGNKTMNIANPRPFPSFLRKKVPLFVFPPYDEERANTSPPVKAALLFRSSFFFFFYSRKGAPS